MVASRILTVLLSLAVLISCLSGCGTRGAQDKVLRVVLSGEPETLDPRRSLAALESSVERQLFSGLTIVDEKGNPQPDAAQSWDISPDGMIFTFHLRPDMKWSNGDKLTARDFEYSWKSELDPKLASRAASTLYNIKNAEAYNRGKANVDAVGVRAVDKLTLRVELEKPAWYFLVLVANRCFYPVHQATVEKDDKWAAKPETFVGNGAFKLASWSHNGKIIMEKNPNYYDADKVRLDRLELVICDNAATTYNMFCSGQLDIGSAPPTEYERLKAEGKLRIVPQLGTMFLALNCQSPQMKNLKVRQALNMAIDRKTICDKITKLGERPAFGYVPYECRGSNERLDYREEIGPLFKEDVSTAQKLLAEAGYPGGKGLNGITLLYFNSDYNKAVCEAIQEMWRKNLGVQVKLLNQEQKVWLNSLRTGDFIITRSGYIGSYTDAMTMLETYDTTLDFNDSHWEKTADNERYNKLLNEAGNSSDQALRVKKMAEAERIIIAEQTVMIPLLFYTSTMIEQPYVKGVLSAPIGYSNYKEAYIER